jgi:hypothetical protein
VAGSNGQIPPSDLRMQCRLHSDKWHPEISLPSSPHTRAARRLVRSPESMTAETMDHNDNDDPEEEGQEPVREMLLNPTCFPRTNPGMMNPSTAAAPPPPTPPLATFTHTMLSAPQAEWEHPDGDSDVEWEDPSEGGVLTRVHAACEGGDADGLAGLLGTLSVGVDAKGQDGDTALHLACLYGGAVLATSFTTQYTGVRYVIHHIAAPVLLVATSSTKCRSSFIEFATSYTTLHEEQPCDVPIGLSVAL